MHDQSIIKVFERLRRKWVISTVTANIFIAAIISGGVNYLLFHFLTFSFLWFFPLFFLLAVLLVFTDRSWRISDEDVARYLDINFPQLEESSRLVLQTPDTLPGLQQLQLEKTKKLLVTIEAPGEYSKKIHTAGWIFVMVLSVCSALSFIPVGRNKISLQKKNPDPSELMNTKNLLPSISGLELTIEPPTYTRREKRMQSEGSVSAEEGSTISWQIVTSKPVSKMELVMNDVKSFSLQRSEKDSNEWRFDLALKGSGFYQLRFDSVLSPLYRLESIKDEPPEIVISSPQPDLLIKYGEPPRVSLQALLSDDYGIKNAFISATVSSGSGEAVKFTQKTIPFNSSFESQARVYNLKQPIDLKILAMQPGDELYLFVTAIDNHRQQKRSDIFRVILEDTAQLFNMEGLISGLDIKPEFFRSQRQIIIETEQLIRDKHKLTEEEFRNKSNNLGLDQKLLRLRYGKFLGEEAVTYGQGDEEHHEEGDGHDHEQPVQKNKVQEDILSDFGHSHDNAEDATYFDPATKAQLKATLNEMWKAELHLRTFKLPEALPFEYEALRLLKDLQQKSRMYVAKTNLKTTPLQPGLRLTGDLKEIIQPVFIYSKQFKPDQSEPLRRSLSDLQQLKYRSTYNQEMLAGLVESHPYLSARAIEEPAMYLQALGALRRVIPALRENKTVTLSDILMIEKAFQQIIEKPLPLPVAREGTTGKLTDAYFNYLKNSRVK